MNVSTFETKLLSEGLEPIYLIMGKGRNVKWFICKNEVIGRVPKEPKEYCLLVYDENGRCFINPKKYTEIDLNVIYNVHACDEERIVVNNDFFYNEPLCDLKFSDEP